MKKLLILGAGTAGTMMLNKLHPALAKKGWDISIVDNDPLHYYQPGFLFIPFGIYRPNQVVRAKEKFFPEGITAIWEEVERVIPEDNQVLLASGKKLDYDVLIIATGTSPNPDETPGLKGKLWYKDIFDFYTYEGTTRLAEKLKDWEGGRLVINLAEILIKCPVAPLEFAFLADAYFAEKGMRDRVEIYYVTPLPGAFTKPKATEILSGLLKKKNIEVVPDFYLERVDEERKEIVSYDERRVAFDLLVSVPVNMGAEFVERSNMGDEDDLNFIPTDKHSLQSKAFDNVFVIGDATNVPTSKAGSVVHFMSETLYTNILNYIDGKPLESSFDGHANCFIETGFGKATLIDFNYDTEPLPGKYPIPWLGPMSLLKESRLNHAGKLIFRWIYWRMLITGKELPVSVNMTLAGKEQSGEEKREEVTV